MKYFSITPHFSFQSACSYFYEDKITKTCSQRVNITEVDVNQIHSQKRQTLQTITICTISCLLASTSPLPFPFLMLCADVAASKGRHLYLAHLAVSASTYVGFTCFIQQLGLTHRLPHTLSRLTCCFCSILIYGTLTKD